MVSIKLFMEVLEKITCWYSDNSLNSFTNKGIVHKKKNISHSLLPWAAAELFVEEPGQAQKSPPPPPHIEKLR